MCTHFQPCLEFPMKTFPHLCVSTNNSHPAYDSWLRNPSLAASQRTRIRCFTLLMIVHFFRECTNLDDSLVRKCKGQEVVFDNFSLNVIRLKIPVPSSPGSDSVGGQRFITRMKDTDFFQAMSMYLSSRVGVIAGSRPHSHSPVTMKKKLKRRILKNTIPSYKIPKSRASG